MNTVSNEEKPALSAERVQEIEQIVAPYGGLLCGVVAELTTEIRRLQDESSWDAAAADTMIRTQGQLLTDRHQQLVDCQDAFYRREQQYQELVRDAEAVCVRDASDEAGLTALRRDIEYLSTTLNRQANDEPITTVIPSERQIQALRDYLHAHGDLTILWDKTEMGEYTIRTSGRSGIPWIEGRTLESALAQLGRAVRKEGALRQDGVDPAPTAPPFPQPEDDQGEYARGVRS